MARLLEKMIRAGFKAYAECDDSYCYLIVDEKKIIKRDRIIK